jgi:hypothetical protein
MARFSSGWLESNVNLRFEDAEISARADISADHPSSYQLKFPSIKPKPLDYSQLTTARPVLNFGHWAAIFILSEVNPKSCSESQLTLKKGKAR